MKLRTVKGKLITVDGKLCTANFEYVYLWGSDEGIEYNIFLGHVFRIDSGTYRIIYYSGAVEYYNNDTESDEWCVDRCYFYDAFAPKTESYLRIPLPGVSGGRYQTKAEAEAAAAGSESTITITSGWMSLFFDKASYMFSPGKRIIYKLVRIV